jgi:predicted transposase YbfD/YdcC
MVSAFAAGQRLALGQVRVADKTNKIVAIPKLLELLAIEGAVVTIDAMGCQRAVAKKILDRRADYVLALKGNQGTLRDDVELFAAELKANGFKNTAVSRSITVDGDHGRVETCEVTVFHDAAWLRDRHEWPGLSAVVMVESRREPDSGAVRTERQTRFYITSLTLPADRIGAMVRDHWAVENSLRLRSWTWSSATMNAACEPTTHPPTSPPSSTSPST